MNHNSALECYAVSGVTNILGKLTELNAWSRLYGSWQIFSLMRTVNAGRTYWQMKHLSVTYS